MSNFHNYIQYIENLLQVMVLLDKKIVEHKFTCKSAYKIARTPNTNILFTSNLMENNHLKSYVF